MKSLCKTKVLHTLGIVYLIGSFGFCTAEAAQPAKRYRLGLSMAYTVNRFDEEQEKQPTRGVAGFRQVGLTMKAALRYYLVPPLVDMEANVYGTVLPVVSTHSSTQVRFLGSNLRLGLVVPYLPSWMGLTLMGGYYYVTMFVTQDAFGYQHLRGPQVYPELSWVLSRQSQAPIVFTAYYKYSPVAPTLSSLTFKSREISYGLNIRYPIGGQGVFPQYAYLKAISVGFNYTDLYIKMQSLRLAIMQSKAWSVYVGYDY